MLLFLISGLYQPEISADPIYEFRVNYGSNEFRIFFIYDGDTVVVLFNCFKKKTQKTPDSEIKKAVQLKKEYYEQKERNL